MTDTGQVPGEGHPDNAGMVDQQGIPAQAPPLPPVPPQAPAGYAFQDLVDDSAEGEDEELLLMPSGQGAWSDPQPVPPAPVFPVEPQQAYPDYPQPLYTEQTGGVYAETPYAQTPYAETPAADNGHPGLPQDAHPAPAQPEPAYSAGAHEAGGRDSGALGLGGLVVPPPAAASAAPAATARRPLHMGPAVPEAGGLVRSLADRGPATAPAAAAPVTPIPVRRSGPPTTGPEYLDVPQPEEAPEAAVPPAVPQQADVPPQAGTPWTAEPEAGAAAPEAVAVAESAPVVEPAPVAEPEPVADPAPGAGAAPVADPAPVAEPAGEPAAAVEPAPEPSTVAAPEPVAAEAEPQPAPEPAAPLEPAAAAEPAPVAAEAAPAPAAEPAQVEPAQVDAVQEPEPQPHPAPADVAAAEPAEAAAAPETPEPPVAEEAAPAGAEPLPAEAAPVAEPAAEPQEQAQVPVAVAAEPLPAVDEAPAPAGTPELPEGPELLAPAVAPGEPAPAYADADREAIQRVMRERRDIRKGFRPDPIPHDVLLRVLEAAHTAPSVGHSQPWDFVVIRSAETRRTMHELAQRQREAYAKSLPKGRAKQFKELKIEAILDTPVNIVVTADPTRGGRHTLGRHTQPQMAPYSSALAVENLWLAARAEGIGVGWVSFFDEREMVRELGLPEHLEVVAYLCVGYVDEFPEEPELAQAGWSQRRPLAWVVHEETYGRRALPGEEPHDLLSETVAGIRPLDAKALGEAWERQKRMTKPAGALGMLEIISAQLAGLSRVCPPPIPEPAAVAIFAGDHGVHAQGVTPWPQEVTTQMVANFLGGGAVCNAFANQVGAEVCVIDVGVAGDLPATPGLLPRKVRPGTADLSTGPAMTREEAVQAIEVGIETARDLVAAGNKALLTGEMGIANTTVSAALISVFTGVDPAEVTGRGTGINDETHARKVEVVRRALELHQPDPADPIGVLAAIGGLEHAAIVGLLLGGASLRTPVILDGVSAGAAALVARAIAPESLSACIAGHRSAEPGHVAALNKLGLRPLVDLDLRLGEGTGALLALPLVQSAARAMHEVATFDSAGVTEK
ncbi:MULTISPECIES: nicotinate-nucleotide--dimethylbenzimidazole phosphoribosyltransferase [unclassified Streptomyces]|uniref:nicotinate-nucleotide--dimethylbenzimidazole phosphoribosyltransferase n=1 Tax=unclassified Streptomyces TaxID=2593676 RepID=UPI002E3495FE|nr:MULTISPECIES: nicotinate-nucleotide--dimethylbenzimidazole phosphoribosyltransferase [unclassified Streptomyces]WUC67273.1 nicotinate-nucleotide--dimethylbenzimidazole phosphoribosyltransferase [Streptomyces sp. NBC_00539]